MTTPQEQLLADVDRWLMLKQNQESLREEEKALRMKLFGQMFDEPVEGSNSFKLSDGRIVKYNHKIDRKVLLEMVNNLARPSEEGDDKRSEFEKVGINPNLMFKWKPELEIKAYRKLTEAQLKVFEQSLVSKPASPSLEVTFPSD